MKIPLVINGTEVAVRLTTHEQKLLLLVLKFYSEKEIASEFGVSISAIKHSRSTLYRRFGLPTYAGITDLARLFGHFEVSWVPNAKVEVVHKPLTERGLHNKKKNRPSSVPTHAINFHKTLH